MWPQWEEDPQRPDDEVALEDAAAIHRTDIYRQRVLGTNAGSSSFIKPDDKRKLGPCSLLLYFAFMLTCINYVWPRADVRTGAKVVIAIEDALLRATFAFGSSQRQWKDVEVADDLKSWLTDALPSFISPEVQRVNVLVSEVRFTLRRVQEVENPDPRFRILAPTVWINKNGINPTSRSIGLDNRANFGAYREWMTHKETPPAPGLQWCSLGRQTCDGGELLGSLEPRVGSKAEVVDACRNKCEAMSSPTRPCRCFTLIAEKRCKLYHTPDEALNWPSPSATGGCPMDSRMPNLVPGKRHHEAHWPQMLLFRYQEADRGWRDTPGFVVKLWPRSPRDIALRTAQSSGAASTQARTIQAQIQDWIGGGLLSRGAAAVVVDFVLHNPNFEVFTWCQFVFEVEASGRVVKYYQLKPLRIRGADLSAHNFSPWSELSGLDWIYFILFIVLVAIEVREWEKRGRRYLYLPWSCPTWLNIVLHGSMIISRFAYFGSQDFGSLLAGASDGGLKGSLPAIQRQADSFVAFVYLAALTLFMTCYKAVHYLSCNVKRVELLTSAMYTSWVYIMYLAGITFCLFMAFALFAYILFGKAFGFFSTFGNALLTDMEIMLGETTTVMQLAETYPLAGAVYIVIHAMLLTAVVQSVCKAMMRTSLADAGLSDRLAAKRSARQPVLEPKGHHWIERTEWLQTRIRGTQERFNDIWEKTTPKSVSHETERDVHQSPISTCVWLTYFFIYILVAFLMVQVSWSYDLTSNVTSAVTLPTITKINDLSGRAEDRHINEVSSYEDVSMWLSTALPKIMFNSSVGTFSGEDNFLKTYHAALPLERFTQLVMNDWNIFLGQEPVRITTRYWKRSAVGQDAIGSVLSSGTMLPSRNPGPTEIQWAGTEFDPPFHEAKALADIEDPKAREVVQKYCKYKFAYASEDRKTDANGFSCMLNVEANQTMAILNDMARNHFVNNQTAIVAIDFVIYNGFAESFVYTAVVFQFQPSGEVQVEINPHMLRLDMYSGKYWYRIVLEIIIILMTFFYLGRNIAGMVRAIRVNLDAGRRELNLLKACRAACLYTFVDPFNLMDLISSLATFVLVGVWYSHVFTKLSMEFFMAERPGWDDVRCSSSEWCGDDEILFAFSNQAGSMVDVARALAFNMFCLFLRSLRYLMMNSKARVIVNTLRAAAVDLAWFLVLLALCLCAYSFLGHLAFGTSIRGFGTFGETIVVCLEIFFGTYPHGVMRDAEGGWYFLFTVSFLVIVRYWIINMVFAIVDLHFRTQDLYREEGMMQRPVDETPGLARLRKWIMEGHRSVGETDILVEKMGKERHKERCRTKESLADHQSSSQRQVMEKKEPSLPFSKHGSMASMSEMDDDEKRLGIDRCKKWSNNFQYLPLEVQKWALEAAKNIGDAVEKQHAQRKDNEAQKGITTAHGHETFAEMRKKAEQRAEEIWNELKDKELKDLQTVHRDRESMAWYIMKRETDLEKLEDKVKHTSKRVSDRLHSVGGNAS